MVRTNLKLVTDESMAAEQAAADAEAGGLQPGDIALVEVRHEPDDPSPVVTPASKPELSADDKKANATRDWKIRMEEMTAHLATAALEKLHLETRLKSAKKRLQSIIEMLSDIAEEGPDEGDDDAEELDLDEPVTATETSDTPAATQVLTTCVGVVPQPDPDAWKTRPTTELELHTIKGIGQKKADEIAERCPTVYSLEMLRAEGSFKGQGLRSIAGIGEEKAGAIENRILDWLSKNRDAAVLAQAAVAPATIPEVAPEAVQDPAAEVRVSPVETEAAAESESAPTPPDNDDAELPVDNMPTATEWEAMPGKERDRWLSARMGLLAKETVTGPRIAGAGYWDRGIAAMEGGKREPPPFSPSPALDDWLRGWMFAKGKQKAEAETSAA